MGDPGVGNISGKAGRQCHFLSLEGRGSWEPPKRVGEQDSDVGNFVTPTHGFFFVFLLSGEIVVTIRMATIS